MIFSFCSSESEVQMDKINEKIFVISELNIYAPFAM